MNEAIDQAKASRTAILAFMETVINSPRTEMSEFAPRIETIQINPEKIGLVIGPGGKNIKSIVAETGAEINIEDDGRVKIYSTNGDAMERAKEIILGMVGDIEVGKIYRGRVVTLKDFGAFVEVLPGKDGLVHISEWSDQRVNRMDDVSPRSATKSGSSASARTTRVAPSSAARPRSRIVHCGRPGRRSQSPPRNCA